MKYFILFILYTGLAALTLCVLMFMSFYYLMTTKEKSHMHKKVLFEIDY